ncbi:hypothetical protein D3P07_17615 [Paenibacillus sp. 1011MAR3C5]|uniref:hypothetical protein n=1 Tax=Paenibacillus sp. 1011MAR3C5 TaxID=1675787 RepID=UPI000E6B5B6C|nr:hypothetical protein [Paenibacillus sp. 1011MAR3C5]RJE86992.1 hypothetical protein D3P07_17615 [Paenibacillus sp. 1011MAR3C5]
MPRTKKEEFYFGLMMVTGMVIFMTSYNLIRIDAWETLTWQTVLLQLLVGYVVAFAVEMFVVGPVAKKLAFALPYDKSKKLFVILSLAFFMVTGMVLSMSLFGLGMTYYSGHLNGQSLVASYISLCFHNFIFAFPLQLIVMGPLVRFLFSRFVQNRASKPVLQ